MDKYNNEIDGLKFRLVVKELERKEKMAIEIIDRNKNQKDEHTLEHLKWVETRLSEIKAIQRYITDLELREV